MIQEGLIFIRLSVFFLRKGVCVDMHMTGFEHQMLNLRGLAYAYKVDIVFHCNNRVAIHIGGYAKDLYPQDYENQMIFEETIKDFIRELNNKLGKEVKNDRCINPERFDLP